MKIIVIVGILALGLLPNRAIASQSAGQLPHGNSSWAISDQLNGSVKYDKFGATVVLNKIDGYDRAGIPQQRIVQRMRFAFNPWLNEVIGRRCYVRGEYDPSIVALAKSNPDYRVKVLTQILQAWRATEDGFHKIDASQVSCDNRVHPPSELDDR
ncbi:MAG: hypothetical protein KME10_27670 [Plectolyngbya sp. WJT66-NPBG17]|jgi:hypothetical protein|nr:hypothetical protein [Plectolyngbya sp. WJT66-NPBG17]